MIRCNKQLVAWMFCEISSKAYSKALFITWELAFRIQKIWSISVWSYSSWSIKTNALQSIWICWKGTLQQLASITCISSQPLQTVHEESEQPVGIVHEESPPSSPLLVRNNGNEQFESFDDEKAIEFFSARAITTKQTQVKKGNISTLLFQAKL